MFFKTIIDCKCYLYNIVVNNNYGQGVKENSVGGHQSKEEVSYYQPDPSNPTRNGILSLIRFVKVTLLTLIFS